MGSSRLLEASRQVRAVLTPSESCARPGSQPYLTGLRGVLVLETFLWLFMQTFVPGVISSPRTSTTLWQAVLRDFLSVPFWNASLIRTFIIILSARSICIPFLQDPSATSYAKILIVRSLRIGIPVSLGAGIAIMAITYADTSYFQAFTSLVPAAASRLPEVPPSATAGALSIYNTLWITSDFSDQALNNFWPSHTIWIVSLTYYQSYTVYILMLMLPYTRPAWHWQGLLLFAAGSFWIESWGWYSATGLLLGDISVDPELKVWIRSVFTTPKGRVLPTWIPAALLVFLGLLQKYLWAAAFPGGLYKELRLHPTFELGTTLDHLKPYARLDDYLIVTGVFLLIELFEPAQKILSLRPLTWLGERSLSYFLTQCILFYFIGIRLLVTLVSSHDMSLASGTGVVFLVMVVATPVAAEIFHRAVDGPARWASNKFFDWIREE